MSEKKNYDAIVVWMDGGADARRIDEILVAHALVHLEQMSVTEYVLIIETAQERACFSIHAANSRSHIRATETWREPQVGRVSVPVSEPSDEKENNLGAGLIHPTIPDIEDTEPRLNNEHERVLLLTNIRTSAAAGLTYGTGPTIHTPERIIERKNKALRDILTFLERDGIVGSILRSITEDEIDTSTTAPREVRKGDWVRFKKERRIYEVEEVGTEELRVLGHPACRPLSYVVEVRRGA